jgi:dienelactone hydrolase
MKRGAGAAVLVLVWTLAALPAGARAAGPSFEQPCGGSSWVGGTTNVCSGVITYRDYVYDDEGADRGDVGYNENTQNAFGTLAHPAGDVRYPADDTNAADLVKLELSRAGDTVHVRAELNALRKPDSTILALAVDTDGNASTGGGPWGTLGVSSSGWEKRYEFKTGDPATNTITGSFPLPAAPRWRVQAVTAQAATQTVMNVAFRGPAEHAAYKVDYTNASDYPPSGQGAWFEDDQAAALTAGDISKFGYTVATADLAPDVTRLQTVGAGLHERVYTSDYTLGEGMTYEGIDGRGSGGTAQGFFAQVFNFLGRYQPYGLYIPNKPGPYGLQMEWHGSNQGMTGQINQPGMQRDFGDGLNRILVVPEARGPNGYGSDISERDLLDVMDDVQKAYPVDRTRVFSSGYSQGGYLTFRMAMLFPDRFAGYSSWVGFTGDDANGTPAAGSASVTAGAIGNALDFVGNLRWVPGSMLYGAEDELVQVPSSTAMRQALDATDDPYVWYMHNPADHFTFALADDWRKEAAYSSKQRLVTDPARVTFRTNPVVDSPKYGIRHDSAYWVSDIRGRKEGFIDTDLTSFGCGGREPVLSGGTGAGPSPVPWTSLSKDVTGTKAVPVRQRLEGTLANVASEAIDVSRACLDTGFTYRVTSDGDATLRLDAGCSISLHKGVNEGVATCEKGTGSRSRTCLSRRQMRIHLFRIKRSRVRRVRVSLNGRRQAHVLRGARSSVLVSLRGQPRSVVRVRLSVRLRGGRMVVVRRTYRTCTRKRRG